MDIRKAQTVFAAAGLYNAGIDGVHPSIVAEGTVILAGFSSTADGEWVVEVATHTLTEAGYQTTFTAQRPE